MLASSYLIESRVILAMTKIHNDMDEVEDIETLSALRRLHMKVTIEGSGSIKLLYYKFIVIDETTKLLKYFTSYEVAHVGREGNEAVHKLAINAKSINLLRT